MKIGKVKICGKFFFFFIFLINKSRFSHELFVQYYEKADSFWIPQNQKWNFPIGKKKLFTHTERYPLKVAFTKIH